MTTSTEAPFSTQVDDDLIFSARISERRFSVGTEARELAVITFVQTDLIMPSSGKPFGAYVIEFRSESGDLVTLPEINPTSTLDAAVVAVALACPGAQRVRA